jgi:hypothetical protein
LRYGPTENARVDDVSFGKPSELPFSSVFSSLQVPSWDALKRRSSERRRDRRGTTPYLVRSRHQVEQHYAPSSIPSGKMRPRLVKLHRTDNVRCATHSPRAQSMMAARSSFPCGLAQLSPRRWMDLQPMGRPTLQLRAHGTNPIWKIDGHRPLPLKQRGARQGAVPPQDSP